MAEHKKAVRRVIFFPKRDNKRSSENLKMKQIIPQQNQSTQVRLESPKTKATQVFGLLDVSDNTRSEYNYRK